MTRCAGSTFHTSSRRRSRITPSFTDATRRPAWATDTWRRANFTDRLLLGYFVGLGLLILLQRQRVSGWPAFVALHVLCVSVVIAIVRQGGRFPWAHAWYPLLIPVISFHEVALLNGLFVDGWRDRYLLDFEARLFHEPPTVWLQRVTPPLLTEVFEIGYLSYYVLLPVVAAVLYRREDQAPFAGVMAATMLSYLLCYGVFVAFPTEGPAHTLRHLHTTPLAGGPFRAAVAFVQNAGVHGNAFPSAHVAGAMAPMVFAWRHVPTLGTWTPLLVALLCVAAVNDHYHYVSDVGAGIAVGAAGVWFVTFVQARPRLARWVNIPSSQAARS